MRTASLLILALFAATAAWAQEPAPAQATPPKADAQAPLPKKIRAEDDLSNAPAVTIRRQDNGDTVQEYRENGRLTMVKVTTSAGITYSLLDTNGDGLLDRSDHDGPVGPVYYTLYKWN
jgi:hypothetical protein